MKRVSLNLRTPDSRRRVRPCLTAFLVAAAIGGTQPFETPVRAQTADVPLRGDSVITLDPVTVTARKVEEAQQDVPISITVLGEQALEERRIDDVESVLREVPNVGFSSLGDGRSTFLSIRGIGPISQPLGYDDTSTVTYVDGVPQPLFGSDLSIMDAERIEVMRGPQGTLFGRNAQAGAINIVTREPGDRAEFTARGELGTDWHRLGQGSVSGPLISDTLAGRLAVFYSGVDGDVDNIAPGTDDLGDMETGALRGSLVATPGPDTRITLGIFGQRDDNQPSNFVLKSAPGFPVVAADPEGEVERDLAGVSLTASHEFSDVTLTSVTAFNYYDYQGFTTNSEALTYAQVFGLPVGAFLPATDFTDIDERQTSFYQEVRLNGDPQADVLWVGGLVYYYDDFERDDFYQSAFFAVTNGTRNNDYSTNSYAAFGEATAPDDAVEQAARAARAHGFITRLRDGYATRLDAEGGPLSGGERQRIAIARALLNDAPILVLDEATANIDFENEAEIQAALGSLTQGRTLLVIAHRLWTVTGADEIWVIDRGQIVQRGPHDRLLAEEGGLYRRLWDAQSQSRSWRIAGMAASSLATDT